jgi:uncharacterized protein DUF1707
VTRTTFRDAGPSVESRILTTVGLVPNVVHPTGLACGFLIRGNQPAPALSGLFRRGVLHLTRQVRPGRRGVRSLGLPGFSSADYRSLMSGDLVTERPAIRMADADREAVAQRLHQAVGEGRLTLEEFEQRVAGVHAARTFAEVEPYVADLPGGPVAPPAPEHAELRTTASSLKRQGRWVVPRRLTVTARAGSVKLDFTEAVLPYQVVEIDLNVTAGSTVLVLPSRATVDIDSVEMIAGSAKAKVPTNSFAGAGRHFVVRGSQRAGSLVVRYQRHFWRWRW